MTRLDAEAACPFVGESLRQLRSYIGNQVKWGQAGNVGVNILLRGIYVEERDDTRRKFSDDCAKL